MNIDNITQYIIHKSSITKNKKGINIISIVLPIYWDVIDIINIDNLILLHITKRKIMKIIVKTIQIQKNDSIAAL